MSAAEDAGRALAARRAARRRAVGAYNRAAKRRDLDPAKRERDLAALDTLHIHNSDKSGGTFAHRHAGGGRRHGHEGSTGWGKD